MIIVIFCRLLVVASGLQCIVCCNRIRVVECARPFLDHFVEKARSTEPKS